MICEYLPTKKEIFNRIFVPKIAISMKKIGLFTFFLLFISIFSSAFTQSSTTFTKVIIESNGNAEVYKESEVITNNKSGQVNGLVRIIEESLKMTSDSAELNFTDSFFEDKPFPIQKPARSIFEILKANIDKLVEIHYIIGVNHDEVAGQLQEIFEDDPDSIFISVNVNKMIYYIPINQIKQIGVIDPNKFYNEYIPSKTLHFSIDTNFTYIPLSLNYKVNKGFIVQPKYTLKLKEKSKGELTLRVKVQNLLEPMDSTQLLFKFSSVGEAIDMEKQNLGLAKSKVYMVLQENINASQQFSTEIPAFLTGEEYLSEDTRKFKSYPKKQLSLKNTSEFNLPNGEICVFDINDNPDGCYSVSEFYKNARVNIPLGEKKNIIISNQEFDTETNPKKNTTGLQTIRGEITVKNLSSSLANIKINKKIWGDIIESKPGKVIPHSEEKFKNQMNEIEYNFNLLPNQTRKLKYQYKINFQ